MRTALIVMSAMLKRYALETRQYAFNTFMGLLVAYMFFFMIFVGAWASAGDKPGFGETVSEVVVGLMVWLLALSAFSDVAGRISSEAAQGTLEQLAMSPVGLGAVVVYRAFSQFFIQLATVLVFLLLMMATTGRWLHLDLLSLVPLLALTVAGAQGVGLAMGGLTLIFKRTGATLGLLQFVFIALLAVPPEKLGLMRYLPLSWGAHMSRRVMIEELSILQLPATDLLFLTLNGAGYFAAGFGIFRFCEWIARGRGMLGHY